jgi:transcriptional regulator of met regulon
VKSSSKHGKRAEGITTLSIPMPVELAQELKILADSEERPRAQVARRYLAKLVAERKALQPELFAPQPDPVGADASGQTGDSGAQAPDLRAQQALQTRLRKTRAGKAESGKRNRASK